jgi:hypothetical protein
MSSRVFGQHHVLPGCANANRTTLERSNVNREGRETSKKFADQSHYVIENKWQIKNLSHPSHTWRAAGKCVVPFQSERSEDPAFDRRIEKQSRFLGPINNIGPRNDMWREFFRGRVLPPVKI